MGTIRIVALRIVMNVVQYPIYLRLKVVVLQLLLLIILYEVKKMLIFRFTKKLPILGVMGIND